MQSGISPKRAWTADRRIITIGFWIAAATELAVLGILFANTLALISSKDWVTHSHVILENLGTILANLGEASVDQRLYLVAGDKTNLDAYATLEQSIHQQIDQMRDLTSDNPSQLQNVNALDQLVTSRLTSLRQQIAVYDQQGSDAAQKAVSADQARTVMSNIRRQVALMN